MRKKKSTVALLLASCLYVQGYSQTAPLSEQLIPPLKIAPAITGNFAELRSGHFHSGLDYSTNRRTGIPVFAVANGFVSRVVVSHTGFGKAIYIDHPSGITTVYAHVEKFFPLLDKYVKDEQYKRESFTLDIKFPPGIFAVNQEDTIAFSGNTGSSSGPHLHFEIRDTKSERPQNPLLYGLNIEDNRPPNITSVYIYPVSEHSHVNNKRDKHKIETVFYDGKYHLKRGVRPVVGGDIAFGVSAIDYLDAGWSKCGIYSATLLIDSDTIYSFQIDDFSFGLTRYINSHVDFEEHVEFGKWVHKLHREPGNELDFYNKSVNEGVLHVSDGDVHNVEIVVSDTHGNKSSVAFRIKGRKNAIETEKKSFSQLFLHNKENHFATDSVRLKIPSGRLYQDMGFIYSKSPKKEGVISTVHNIHKTTTPVHKPYMLEVVPEQTSRLQTEKLLLVTVDKKSGKKSPLVSKYEDGVVKANPRTFGSFAVALDTIPPSIRALSIRNKSTLIERDRVRFIIKDDLSGIKSYRGEINGEWMLFEYDAKSNMLTHYFDDKKINFSSTHNIKIEVEDYKGNKAEYNAAFYR